MVNLLGGLAQAMAPSKYEAVAQLLGSRAPTHAIALRAPLSPSLVDKVGLVRHPYQTQTTFACVIAIRCSATIVCPLPGRPRGKAHELPVAARVSAL